MICSTIISLNIFCVPPSLSFLDLRLQLCVCYITWYCPLTWHWGLTHLFFFQLLFSLLDFWIVSISVSSNSLIFSSVISNRLLSPLSELLLLLFYISVILFWGSIIFIWLLFMFSTTFFMSLFSFKLLTVYNSSFKVLVC